MAKKPDAQAFLAALGSAVQPEETVRPPSPQVSPAPASASASASEDVISRPLQPRSRGKGGRPRADLIHFGGYLDSVTFEKIALLRLRLRKDNSELIELAIDDLFRKHSAKRAFGDV